VRFSKPERLDIAGGNGQHGKCGDLLTEPLSVKVSDRYGQTVRGAAVEFRASNGEIVPNQPVLSDSSGLVHVSYRLPAQVGFFMVTAELSGRPESAVTFQLFAEEQKVLHLSLLSGADQVAAPGEELPEPVRVGLVDDQNQGKPGRTLVFKVVEGGGTIANLDFLRIVTDSKGIAEVNWRLGPRPGEQLLQIYQESAPENALEVAAVARRVPAFFEWYWPSRVIGIAGKPANDSLIIIVRDASGYRVADVPVQFSIVEGGGRVNDLESVVLMSNTVGEVRCEWLLGPVAGEKSQLVQISADGVRNSPLRIGADVQPREAYRLTLVSGDGQSALVGNEPSADLVCAVSDTFCNAVAGHPVFYEVMAGSAFFDEEKSIEVLTDAQGQASVRPTLGERVGAVEIQANAVWEGLNLLQSPIRWTLQALARPFNPQLSFLTATPSVTANGRDFGEIRCLLRDDRNLSVAATPVVFQVSGSQNQLNRERVLTDQDGCAVVELRSTRAERKRVWATVDGLPATADCAHIFFLAGPPAYLVLADSMQWVVPVGRPVDPPIAVVLSDSFANGVSDRLLSVLLINPSGLVQDSFSVTTDSCGGAEIALVLGWESGLYRCSISLDGIEPLDIPLLAIPGETLHLEKAFGDEQEGRPGAALLEPIAVRVVDEWNNPVPQIGIEFRVVSGGGSIAPSEPVWSDDDGLAQVGWTLGTSGTQEIEAGFAGVDSQKVVFRARLAANRPPEIESVVPPDTLVLAHSSERLQFRVTAFDPDGDSLTYRWTLNEIFISNQIAIQLNLQPGYPPQSLIRVTVRDGDSSVEHRWHLLLSTDVVMNTEIPQEFSLEPNYPNPFNPETQLCFSLPERQHIRLEIYNASGQRTRILADTVIPAGRHRTLWDGRDDQGRAAPSGCYIAVLSNNSAVARIKMVLLK
ncbi:hypothetical protein JW992_07835, partial [candidate division KSB1 bacterium]|nr:hypothetical protein [candidate division KSB1 bacterium]